VKKEAPINIQDQQGLTPLMLAAQYGSENMVSYLVENQADFKLKNTAGENALDLARKRNRQKTVEYLETKIKKE
jgi:hypothetical protein